MMCELVAMASSLRAFSFAQATPSYSIHGVKLPYLACHQRPCDIHFLALHTAVIKTKVQVATISDASSIPAPPKTSLARRFSHLDELALEISSSDDVSSTLQPWIDKLTIQEWYALLMDDTNGNWHFAWEMFSVLKENSSLLESLTPEHEASQIEGDGAETLVDNAPELTQGDVAAHGETLSDSEPELVQPEAPTEDAPGKRRKKTLTRLKLYTNIVRVLARHGRDAEVKEVMEQMQEAGIEPDNDFYDKLLDSVLIGGRIDKANEVLLQMEEAGVKPDHFTLEKLAYAYLREEENLGLGKAMEILKELVKGNGPTSKGLFTNLITAHWAANEPDGVEEVFEAMQTAGHTPDLKVFFKLMQLHARRGNHERVLELVEMLSKFELEPNCGVFDSLLLAYCKAGLVEKAKEAFTKYQSVLKIRPSVVAYNMLVDVLGKQGLHEEALQAFEDIRKARRSPSAVSYSCIISALVKAGNFEKVDQLYRRMLKDKIKPNLHTYVMLIHSYTKRNQTRNGHQIYNAMKRSNVQMTEVAFCAVLRLYVEGNWYTIAAATLKQMEEKGVPLDAASHGSLVRSFGILEPHALTPLAKAIQESNYEVCKVLRSLFLAENPKTESEFLDILSPFFEKWNISDDVDAKAQIYTAFLDCLWKKNLKARCKWLLGLAREAYADYTRPHLSESEWTLDVRGLSIGGGKVAVTDWLSSMDKASSGNAKDDTKVIIITGDELQPHVIQDNRLLKGALISMLEELSSPFAESEDDSTKLQASAVQVLKWLSDGSVKDSLSLVDCC